MYTKTYKCVNVVSKLDKTYILLAYLFIVLIDCSAAYANLIAEDPCKLHTGLWGVCKNARACKWLIQNIERKQMSYSDIRRCSFSDQNEDIVCCGDVIPYKLDTNPFKSALIFKKNEVSGTTTQRTIENVKPTIKTPSKVLGSRAIEACLQYSALAAYKKYSVFARSFLPIKIINGPERDAELSEFPHMVAFGYKNNKIADQNTYKFECGGSLIAERWVLTAAHCVRDKRKPVIARMGKVTLETNEDQAMPVDRTISNIIRHPKYSLVRKKNDIALVQLNAVVVFNAIVRPACLYTDLADLSGTKDLIIAGWGSIEAERTKLADSLLKANVNIVPLKQCSERLEEYNKLANNPSLRGLIQGQICAKNSFDNSDSCGGDSGGPLMEHSRQTGVSTVVGIISFGVSCGSALPGIYTRVAFYLDWIEKIVWP